MIKTMQNKAKRSGPKKSSDPLKVALPFSRKSPSKSDVNEESPKKVNRKSERKSLLHLCTTKALPLHSSTPKPLRKTNSTASEGSDSSQTNTLQDEKLQQKIVIRLQRVEIEDYSKNQAKSPQPLPKTTVLKKAGPKSKKLKTAAPVYSKPLRSASGRGKRDTPPLDYDVNTQIPSDVLENFGISRPETASPSSKSSTCTVLMDTPPRTSTACSSNNGLDQSLTIEDTEPVSFLRQSTPKTISAASIAPTAIVSCSPASANVSSNNQADPLDTHLLAEPCDFIVYPAFTHCDLLYGLAERLYFQPKLYGLKELNYGSADIRKVAPYALKFREDSDEFALFAAAVSQTVDKFCCLIFGVLDHYLIAYGGHFLVDKDRLYNPISKMPAADINLTNLSTCRQHLSLLNIPNKTLLGMEDYFPLDRHPSYSETQLSFLEIFMASINQVQLKETVRCGIAREQLINQFRKICASKDQVDQIVQTIGQGNYRITSALTEPRSEQTFGETCLPINDESLHRILKYVSPMASVKAHHSHLGSLQLSCAYSSECHTPYYAAYEGSGCTSFYQTAFLLGRIDSRFVVGVVEGKNFFVIATQRVYNRSSALSPEMDPVVKETFDNIYLPLWLPHEHALAILEARQILNHSYQHRAEFNSIIQALGIAGFQNAPPPSSSFVVTASTKDLHFRAWLERMVNEHFNSDFRDSFCRFPEQPTNVENPRLFAENIVKLWVQQLLRKIHGRESLRPTHDGSLAQLPPIEFFNLDVGAFCSNYLNAFGMTNDFTFKCLRLAPDGTPSEVCCESIPARQLGLHVSQHHTLPLLFDENSRKELSFIPFSLVFDKSSVSVLDDKNCDYDVLSWAKYLTERLSKGNSLSYLKVLQMVDGQLKSTPAKRVRPGKDLAVAKQVIKQRGRSKRPATKRKRMENDLFEVDGTESPKGHLNSLNASVDSESSGGSFLCENMF